MATARGGKKSKLKSPAKPHKEKTYPVWIGNLHEDVTDDLLKQKFVGLGPVLSSKVMRDKNGRSKNFGYVNFAIKGPAELAAKKLNGLNLMGKMMKNQRPGSIEEGRSHEANDKL